MNFKLHEPTQESDCGCQIPIVISTEGWVVPISGHPFRSGKIFTCKGIKVMLVKMFPRLDMIGKDVVLIQEITPVLSTDKLPAFSTEDEFIDAD